MFDVALDNLKCFNPNIDQIENLPNISGIMFVTSRDIKSLPLEMVALEFNLIFEKPVIYIGTSKNIQSRINQHLNGTARNSTLRRSIGVLMNLEKLMLQGDNKYKFIAKDESSLSNWMHKNLVIYYIENEGPNLIVKLIDRYNPPLNIQNNHNEINLSFRKLLKEIRRV